LNMNYNKWKDEEHYEIKAQLMFEAERELLKSKKEKDITFYYIGDDAVAGIEEGYKAELRLYSECSPALRITSDSGEYVGMIFLKDVDKDD